MAKMKHPSAAEVTHDLQGIDFPARKDGLVEWARGKNAKEEVLTVLMDLPDREYKNMAEVMSGFGEELGG
jgi:hypothetical protein